MYWGKPDAASESKGSAVFHAANDYVSVLHLAERLQHGRNSCRRHVARLTAPNLKRAWFTRAAGTVRDEHELPAAARGGHGSRPAFADDSRDRERHDGATGYGGVSSNVNVMFGAVVNKPPVAKSETVTMAEDTSKAIKVTGSDPEGYNVTYERTSSPTHGVLRGIVPKVTYTPEKNWNGTDCFSFSVMDSDGAVSEAATFSFKVNDGSVDSETATIISR